MVIFFIVFYLFIAFAFIRTHVASRLGMYMLDVVHEYNMRCIEEDVHTYPVKRIDYAALPGLDKMIFNVKLWTKAQVDRYLNTRFPTLLEGSK